jgi:hypothetical protein
MTVATRTAHSGLAMNDWSTSSMTPTHGSGEVRQLREYGFDDVSEDRDDGFHPHVTLTWPRDETARVDLSVLPVGEFSGVLTDLALYGLSPKGTCTTGYGSTLTRRRDNDHQQRGTYPDPSGAWTG